MIKHVRVRIHRSASRRWRLNSIRLRSAPSTLQVKHSIKSQKKVRLSAQCLIALRSTRKYFLMISRRPYLSHNKLISPQTYHKIYLHYQSISRCGSRVVLNKSSERYPQLYMKELNLNKSSRFRGFQQICESTKRHKS